jgi:hypothetical protein
MTANDIKVSTVWGAVPAGFELRGSVAFLEGVAEAYDDVQNTNRALTATSARQLR